jgi:hypothetical protein
MPSVVHIISERMIAIGVEHANLSELICKKILWKHSGLSLFHSGWMV